MDKIVEISRKNGVATLRFLSGEEVRVPSAVYLERRPHVNQALDPEAYRLFARQRGYAHALEAAMKFLALRERSCGEVRQRLRRSCYDPETIDRVIGVLADQGLLSDVRFAGEWVNHRARKYGRGRIAQELRRKGVASQEVQAALDSLPEETEMEQAAQQARKLARKFRNDPQKIIHALVRRGYSWSLARRAAETALE